MARIVVARYRQRVEAHGVVVASMLTVAVPSSVAAS